MVDPNPATLAQILRTNAWRRRLGDVGWIFGAGVPCFYMLATATVLVGLGSGRDRLQEAQGDGTSESARPARRNNDGRTSRDITTPTSRPISYSNIVPTWELFNDAL